MWVPSQETVKCGTLWPARLDDRRFLDTPLRAQKVRLERDLIGAVRVQEADVTSSGGAPRGWSLCACISEAERLDFVLLLAWRHGYTIPPGG
jgi:hypothetical protein